MSEPTKQENLGVTQSETRTCGFSNYSVCQEEGLLHAQEELKMRKHLGIKITKVKED